MVSETRILPPEHVHVVRDKKAALDATIVVHSTALGPAAGGCRFWTYDSPDAMAADACRLAEGMSYKNALADLPLGGGKAVLRIPNGPFNRRALFKAFGRAVRDLHGQYVTAEDVGTKVEDMHVVAKETRHVAGLTAAPGRAGGDPSPWTARGVFLSMRLAAEIRLERPLSECTVAIQGVGNVGAHLARMLHAAGAKLVIADINAHAVAQVAAMTGAEVTSLSTITTRQADIFAPCALGGVLNDRTIGALAAKVVCGAANNQLGEPEDGVRLADRDILYAPDYVVNSGGIINVAAEYLGWSATEGEIRVEATADRLARVLEHARVQGLSVNAAADDLARNVIGRSRLVPRIAA